MLNAGYPCIGGRIHIKKHACFPDILEGYTVLQKTKKLIPYRRDIPYPRRTIFLVLLIF
jgi:hypothetical protein